MRHHEVLMTLRLSLRKLFQADAAKGNATAQISRTTHWFVGCPANNQR